MNRTPQEIWESLDTDLPQPGVVPCNDLGIDGPPEPLPLGDADFEEDMS